MTERYPKTGWYADGSQEYYSDKDGKMQTGWLVDNRNTYFLNPSGAVATGWIVTVISGTMDKSGKKYLELG